MVEEAAHMSEKMDVEEEKTLTEHIDDRRTAGCGQTIIARDEEGCVWGLSLRVRASDVLADGIGDVIIRRAVEVRREEQVVPPVHPHQSLLLSLTTSEHIPIPVDQRGRLNERAVRSVAVNQLVHVAVHGIPIRTHMLKTYGGVAAADRVAVDFPGDVQASAGSLEPRDVDHAALAVVAEQRAALCGEGTFGRA